ncbi:hypothetical protein KG112_04385 [Nocardioides sp. zg-ZUI104]|uniref:hypothetical protein n=1 Tax=Nocardioides faecalis TaxID=2803858 RepID=UPI001BD0A4A1|nr:hypothetical protein [Nocardioides faecalis]MBS4752044.1 hypothetical protein [Nocardioides faecalis]
MTEHLDAVPVLPDGGRLLHIGLPKTGTTALQAALWNTRDELEARGAHNVSRGQHERRVALTATGEVPSYWAPAEARWAELALEFRTCPSRVTFWSSESLSTASPQRIAYLAEQLGDRAHIVTTLRALAPQLSSRWQQGLRRGNTAGLETWLRQRFAEVGVDGTVHATGPAEHLVLHRFSPRRILEQWGAVYGEENLVFVIPAPNDRDGVLRVFERLLGVPAGLLQAPAGSNRSLPFPEAELLRRFAAHYARAGGDRDTWMRTAGDLRRVGLQDIADGATPYPITVPRWAAEQANEYAHAWGEALAASAATVVGDVRHLLVDPERFPDQAAVPAQVDLDSAGRMLDELFRVALTEPPPDATPSGRTLEDAGGRELARELARRVRRRLRRR